jgi:hypothetical protein
MPLNAASHAEDLAVKAGKPQAMAGRDGKRRRGWKGFYGSVHDIVRAPLHRIVARDLLCRSTAIHARTGTST